MAEQDSQSALMNWTVPMLMNGGRRWERGNEGRKTVSESMRDEEDHIRDYITQDY